MLRISEALGRTLDTQALLTNMIDGLLEIFHAPTMPWRCRSRTSGS